MIKNILLASMILILITSCGPVTSVPSVWFDQPLTGASFPLVPIEITIHATDPGGISQVQLFMNGDPLETIPNQFADIPLAIFTSVRVPPAPGKYSLQVAARSNAGSWSELVETIILILGDRSDGETSQPATEQVEQSSPTWTMTPSLEPPTSTFTVTPRVILSATPTYIRPSLTPTPTYVRPSLTPTPTYFRPSLTPTNTCDPSRTRC
jgi:hypothetical protein